MTNANSADKRHQEPSLDLRLFSAASASFRASSAFRHVPSSAHGLSHWSSSYVALICLFHDAARAALEVGAVGRGLGLVGLAAVLDLKPQIGHNVGLHAQIQRRDKQNPSSCEPLEKLSKTT